MPLMTPEELIRAGRIEECLAAVEQAVRSRPADPKNRVLLFQVLALLGRWERAVTQLEVVAELDPANTVFAQMYGVAVACERFRAEVFAGSRAPLILGEPEPWIGMMVQSLALDGKGEQAAADEMRAKALEAAPTSAGSIEVGPEGKSQIFMFEWIADFDPRLGPMLEAILDGKYYWIPWHRIAMLRLEPPTDLRDLVWLTGQMVLTTGGEKVVLVPARYPGSEASGDSLIRMGRKTEFITDKSSERPMGQRMFTTDAGEYAILETRTIRIGSGSG
jgi:type VI secretion system protein ImpE